MMRISNFLKVLFLIFCVSFLTNCGSGSSSNSNSNGRVSDSDAGIRVTLLNPANGATKVPLSPRIQLLFNKSVLNVNSANVTLRRGSVDGQTVSVGAITESLNNIYEFRPTSKLDRLTTYYVVLESGITDISKRGKLAQSNFSFTTDEGEWDYVVSSESVTDGVSRGNLAISPDGTPYVSYIDKNGQKATVMKFTGESWIYVGSPRFSAGKASTTSLVISPDGTPYMYIDYKDDIDYANGSIGTVVKFNGESWVNVGSGFSNRGAPTTNLTISPDGTPYLLYQTFINPSLTVMKFNGESWVNIGPGLSGAHGATNLAISPDGTPYLGCRYSDGRAIVMRFNGESWVNVSPGRKVEDLRLTISPDGTPYLGYLDIESRNIVTVIKFNGESWVNVGSAGFSPPGTAIFYISLAIGPNGTPYLGYNYLNNDFPRDPELIVMKFNGESWVSVGGSPEFLSAWGFIALAISPDGALYLGSYGSGRLIRVMRFR